MTLGSNFVERSRRSQCHVPKSYAFFGHAPRRSVPETLSRRPHIEEVMEQIELDNRVGSIHFVVCQVFGNP